MKGCDPTIDHGSEHIERLLGVAFREMDDGGHDAYVRCVALILPDLSQGRARCGQLAHAHLGLEQSRAYRLRAHVRARELRLHALSSAQRVQRLIEPTLGKSKATSCVVHDHFGAGVSVRMQRAPRSIEPRVGLIEPACQQQERCARGQGGQDYWVLAPTVASPMPTAS